MALFLMLCALAIALAACGGNKENNGSSGSSEPSESQQAASEEIVIKASNWEFDKPEYIVPKDTPVKIILELDGGHGIKVQGTDINLGPGNTSTVGDEVARLGHRLQYLSRKPSDSVIRGLLPFLFTNTPSLR